MTSPLVSTGGRGQAKACFCFFYDMKNTIIYIDGFNLYYSLKGTPFKWLNIQQLYIFVTPNSTRHLQGQKEVLWNKRQKYFDKQEGVMIK